MFRHPLFFMRTAILLLLLLIADIGTTQSQSDRYVIASIKESVCFLASDSLKGRAAGSEGERCAADYIFAHFKEIEHCKVSRQPFHFVHDSIKYKSQNIIGFIDKNCTETILICAHYDHIGMGGELSLNGGLKAIHNGADDNASGVALLLDIARNLTFSDIKCNVLLLASSGHELGLYGSRYFVEHTPKKYNKIVYMINVDMVGRMDKDSTLYYDCDSTQLKPLEIYGLTYNKLHLKKSTMDRIDLLDSKWYVQRGIPCITLSTGMHLDYHKSTDDAEYINFNGIALTEQFVVDYLKVLGYIKQ